MVTVSVEHELWGKTDALSILVAKQLPGTFSETSIFHQTMQPTVRKEDGFDHGDVAVKQVTGFPYIVSSI